MLIHRACSMALCTLTTETGLFSFEAANVSQALQKGLEHLLHAGIVETSRNGQVLVAPGPVCTVYTNPHQRVLFSPTRDANPFFHFMESMWMLAGCNDIDFVSYFNSGMRNYSDDGTTQWGAYGWRWREFFGWNQLETVIEELRANPDSRRCVVSMWNAMDDRSADGVTQQPFEYVTGQFPDLQVAVGGGKDVPCNTHIYFDLRGGFLNMTVCNRSNDAIWGAYGANAVHFSFLLEYMAMRLERPMGVYRQFSNNLHVYTEKFDKKKLEHIIEECERDANVLMPVECIDPKFDEALPNFMIGLRSFMNRPDAIPQPAMLPSSLLNNTAVPMFNAWFTNKTKKDKSAAIDIAYRIKDHHWRAACVGWLERRMK